MNKTLVMLALAGLVAPGLASAQNAAQPAMGEGHARAAMLAFGCSNLSSLGQGPEGSWHGQCTKGGQNVDVMMDRQGKVTAGRPGHMTEGQARAAMMQAGCSNLSSLSMGQDGNWRAQCTKGGRTVNASVDAQGKATTN